MSATRIGRSLALPWNGFVALFVYVTLLTATVIGGADLSVPAMLAAYLLPVAVYAAILVSRAVHALGAVDIHFHRAPHAIVR